MYGAVPPDATTVAVALLPPLQLTLVWLVTHFTSSVIGSIFTTHVLVHPLPSVTVTE